MQPSDAIETFVAHCFPPQQARMWLRLFRSVGKARFATFVIDHRSMQQAYDAVVLDLRFLAELELYPVIILGFEQVAFAQNEAERLVESLKRRDVLAQIAPIEGSAQDVVNLAQNGIIPVVYFDHSKDNISQHPRDPHHLDQRLACLGEFLSALQTQKLIFVQSSGALRAEDGSRISAVHADQEGPALAQNPALLATQRNVVKQCLDLILHQLDHKILISIVSPLDLLRELFTLKGAGTMFRRGAHILEKKSLSQQEHNSLLALFECAFGRPLDPAILKRPYLSILIESHMRGAALIAQSPLGPYLSKFAVEPQAQGESLGGDLWTMLAHQHKTLLWRSRRHNQINAWYTRKADGLFQTPDWTVFWRGLKPQQLPEAIDFALNQPDDAPI